MCINPIIIHTCKTLVSSSHIELRELLFHYRSLSLSVVYVVCTYKPVDTENSVCFLHQTDSNISQMQCHTIYSIGLIPHLPTVIHYNFHWGLLKHTE